MSARADSTFAVVQPAFLLVSAVCAVALGCLFVDGAAEMAKTWLTREEYSHGVLIPLIAIYLAWQQRARLHSAEIRPSRSALGVVLAGAALNYVGQLASVFTLQQYALVLVIYGLVAAAIGWRAFRALWAPLFILLLMVPLPNFLLNNFSAQLQLLSSQIGVWFIRLFDISVFVEGNVIDLGGYKLQVAEACDGLRYLFPLMTLGFIMAYMFRVALWKRLALFLSTVPITILMNSFRIGTIGVMVEHWGVRMAEGFLHDFQGWVVFMASGVVLVLEMMVLARIGKERRPWREVFGVEPAPAPAVRDTTLAPRAVPMPFLASTVLLAAFALVVLLTPERVETVPKRESFVAFPNRIESWSGRRDALEQVYLDTLKLDDYIVADYDDASARPINFYVAWYDSQRAGQSAHSPRSCLPGGGWRITRLDQVDVADVKVGATPLRVNRVQIELGNHKQVVYYWFQQRGRVITSEYMVKWYLFWDSLTRRRTDGALVRLVTPLGTGEALAAADQRLNRFAADVAPRLERYIPD